MSGEDQDEDAGSGQADRAEVHREEQGAEQRADEGPGLARRREQGQHPGREPWPSSSHTTACRATSDSTAGENSAAAKPISSTAPITAQVGSA